MKNFIFFSMTLLVFLSCETDHTLSNEVVENRIKLHDPPVTQFPDLAMYYDYGGDNFGCEGNNGNCLPTIVIAVPAYQSAIDRLFDVVLHQDQQFVREYILRDKKTLLRLLDLKMVDAVLDGQLYLSVRKNRETQIDYLFFNSAKSEEIVLVYPFKKQLF